MEKKRDRKKVGSYKVKDKNLVNLNKFYKEKIKEWKENQH